MTISRELGMNEDGGLSRVTPRGTRRHTNTGEGGTEKKHASEVLGRESEGKREERVSEYSSETGLEI